MLHSQGKGEVMKVTVHPAVENVEERLSKRNVSRRAFLRCSHGHGTGFCR